MTDLLQITAGELTEGDTIVGENGAEWLVARLHIELGDGTVEFQIGSPPRYVTKGVEEPVTVKRNGSQDVLS